MKGLCGVGQVNRVEPGILCDEDSIIYMAVVLRGRAALPLGGKVAVFQVIDSEQAAAVDRQIEHPVGPAQGLTILKVVKDGDGYAGKRVSVPGQHFASDHRRPAWPRMVPGATPVWMGLGPV